MEDITNLLVNHSLAKSHVYAILNEAVVTITLQFDPDKFQQFKSKVGDKISFSTLDPEIEELECKIMDIESIKAIEGVILLRLTIQKY